jgi:gluconate kinase
MAYEAPNVVSDPPDPNFKIECVVVCDRYADFLRCTLPHNKFIFDRMVVVTSFEDKETQRIFEFYHVECLKTDALESRKGHFCKADGINEGLARLSMEDWVVHLDADIWLPPLTRQVLQQARDGLTRWALTRTVRPLSSSTSVL